MPLHIPGQQTSQEAKNPMKITITLPTDAYFISGIRDFTLNLIRNLTDFSEQWAFRFQSVVDELCNNAIEYGSKPGDTIGITFIHNPGNSIEIIVQDRGTGNATLNAAEIAALVEKRKKKDYIHAELRGRGLSKIVAGWTDEMQFADVENGGLQVRVKKYINKIQEEKEAANALENDTHLVLN